MNEQENLNSVVSTLAGILSSDRFPRGDLAELRRMTPESPTLAFWRVLIDYIPEKLRGNESMENKWLVILNGMAIMAPAVHSSEPSYSVGSVFSDFPIQRITHFLRSKGSNLTDQIRLLARLCRSKGVPVDWQILAYLLFSSEKTLEGKIKRQIAKDYVQSISKKEESA